MRRLASYLLVVLAGLSLLLTATAQDSVRTVYLLDVDGPIGPATSDYIERSLTRAEEDGAQLVVIRMDTPGGLDTSMRVIIRRITGSLVPVATYVHPTGARAASAGTYILYASHIAAMSPGTNLGAATPVQLGGAPGMPPADEDEQPPDDDAAPGRPAMPQDAMARKAINDAVAYIRGLAELRGRNADWAEKAVREAASLPAEAALKENVIDIVARNLDDLLAQIDGRTVNVAGQDRTLETAGLTVVPLEPDWRSRLLAVITNPNVAYILMLIGVYGLIFEFSSPGAIIPGTVGAICLLLALYAFQVLPVNYAGVALILLGVALMIGEAFAPSFGALGIGGVIAFVIGSVILIDTEAPGFGLSPALVGAVALFSAVLLTLMLGMIWRSRHRPVVSGYEGLVGSEGIALSDFDAQGSIRVHGEIWNAQTHRPIKKGQHVRVTGYDGLILQVAPAPTEEREKTP